MKTTLLLHWEKFALGLAIIGLMSVAGIGTQGPDLNVIAEIEKVERGNSDKIPNPTPLPRDPVPISIVAAVPPEPYTASFRTIVPPGPPPKKIRPVSLSGARLEKPAIAQEGISLVLTPEKTPGGVHAPSHFTVERKSTKEDWAMIGRATKDLAFFDGKVAPNTEYSYRVKPGSDTVKPDSVEYSNVVTATAMDIWKISFTCAVAGRAEGDRPTVSVTIMKYDSKSGWVEMTHIHQEGDRIGTWAGADGKPTSKHKGKSVRTGRPVELDFDTQCTIEKIAVDKRIDYTYEHCETTLDCPGTKTLQGWYLTTEIRYTNEARKPVVLQLGGFRKTGRLCADHK